MIRLVLLVSAGVVLIACGSAPKEVERRVPATAVELSLMREEALTVLTEAAASENAQERANAVEGIQFAPARAADIARAGLADENLAVRFVAAMTAGELGDAGLLPAVEPLLRDSSPVVRAAAIYATRRLGAGTDPTPLGGMLLGAASMRERSQAAFILGELGDRTALPLLRDAARRDPSTATLAEIRLLRLQIAEAMCKLGDEDAVETVRAALYPSRPEELEAAALAAQILGEIGDRRSIDQLIYLIEREGASRMPAEVRLAAAGALAKLGEKGGGFVADEYAESDQAVLRAQAAAVYGLLGNAGSVGALAVLLEDADPLVRVAAAAAVLRVSG